MVTREMVLRIALSGATATAAAQTATATENWMPIGRPAQTVTGRVTFAPSEITFQNGNSLSVASDGQMLFRPEAKSKKVMAYLYRVTWTIRFLRTGISCARGSPLLICSSGSPRPSVKRLTRVLWHHSPAKFQRRFARRLWALYLRRGNAIKA